MIAKLDWTGQASRHQGPRPTNGGYLEAVRLSLGQVQERAQGARSTTRYHPFFMNVTRYKR